MEGLSLKLISKFFNLQCKVSSFFFIFVPRTGGFLKRGNVVGTQGKNLKGAGC